MKLSEELKRLHDSGDCGNMLEGIAERAKILEDTALELLITTEIIADAVNRQNKACIGSVMTGAKLKGTTIDFS